MINKFIHPSTGYQSNNDWFLTIIFSFFIAISFLAYLAPVTFPFLELTLGILAVFFAYIIVWFGFNSNKLDGRAVATISPRVALKFNIFFIINLLILPFSLEYVVRFYTGGSVPDKIDNLFNGVSNYLVYQSYFNSTSLSSFSLSKLIPIIANTQIKFNLIFSVYLFFNSKPLRNFSNFYLFYSIFILVLYSISRGTNFEIFEIFICFFYFCSLRYNISYLLFSSIKFFSFALIAVSAVIFYFMESVNTRATISCFTSDLCIDQSGFVYLISSDIGYILFVFSGYFTFGLHYIGHIFSVLIGDYFFEMIFLPIIFGMANHGELLCNYFIDCGVNWEPDLSVLIHIFGFIPSVLILFIIGSFFKFFINDGLLKNNFISLSIGYFIYLYLISLPIAQFITVSSQNILLLMSFLSIFILRKVFHNV